ncbi:hypothetical protein [Cohnella sp. OV330]|uniref:hypothetical protein n=1 Tax=Cohnella sp. OV330 TaxID=1855288 RepID=UPI002100C038|nr:hypothetical protein [Cohnella sp. OV330]
MEVSLLERLPNPVILKKLVKIQASLNIILCRDEWLRYHSFVQDWAEGVSMAKIDNGAGDHLIILFSPEGTIIKGFDHESELSPYAQDEHQVWQGIYDEVPKELLSLLEDDAIEKTMGLSVFGVKTATLTGKREKLRFHKVQAMVLIF